MKHEKENKLNMEKMFKGIVGMLMLVPTRKYKCE